MPRKMKTWEYITKIATSDEGLSLKDTVSFHYFNPNGLWVAKQATVKKIDELVDAGKVKPGAIIAYGGLNSYAYDMMVKMARASKVKSFDVYYMKKTFREDIANAEKFIAETEKKVMQS